MVTKKTVAKRPLGSGSLVGPDGTPLALSAAKGDADNLSAALVGANVNARLFAFDGSTWDRIGAATVGGTTGFRTVSSGITAKVVGSFTRPADTTAYAAGDAVTNSTSAPTAITFANCARSATGTGLLVSALMVDSAAQATKGLFELWLFSASPTPDNDNALFTPTDVECRNVVAILQFSSPLVGDATAGAGGNCVFLADSVNRPFVCADANLYGLVVVRNAYTPVSAEQFDFILQIAQD